MKWGKTALKLCAGDNLLQQLLNCLTRDRQPATHGVVRALIDPRSASLLIFCLLAAACSSTDAPAAVVPSAEAGSDAVEQPDGAGFACDQSDTLDMSGIYALHARLSLSFASHPGGAVTVCPVDQTSDGMFLALVRVQQAPGSPEFEKIEAAVCTLELPVISAVVGQCEPAAPNVVYAGLEFPQKLIDALPATPLAQCTGKLASLAYGSQMQMDRLTFVIGTRATGDSMPGWQMDAAGCGVADTAPGRGPVCDSACVNGCDKLVDDDQDNWAAVTVHVCGYSDDDKKQNVPCMATDPAQAGATIQGRALLDLQVDPLFMAQAVSSCEFNGTFDAAIRYNVVGADLYLQNTQISVASAIKSLPLYKVNSESSRFRAVRIDGKHGAPDWSPDFSNPLATCKTVIARQNEIK